MTDTPTSLPRPPDNRTDPLVQFARWMEEAIAANLPEPNAMTLATATREGLPSARMVLLKGYGPHGFVFYTNYQSRKGAELEANPRAALVLFWAPLQRQIRIEGWVSRVPTEQSDDYFASRGRGSQIAARASAQSRVIPDRTVLEHAVYELENRYAGVKVPRPSHWGGYLVIPQCIEFWEGRPNRLHDRLRYRRTEDSAWQVERLAP